MTKILLCTLLIFLTGCSLFHRRNNSESMAPMTATPPPKVAPAVTAPPSAVEKELDLEEESTKAPAAKVSLKKSHPSTAKLTGIDPEKALLWLQHGNVRFVKGRLRKDGQAKKDILRVSDKQSPHAIIFTSSDSRVPPEIIFDQKLGEIFVIRNVGGSLDESVVSSIEYAMEHFGTRLLVLLGPANTPTQQVRVLGNLNRMKDALPESSEYIKEKLASGELVAKTAIYHLKTGQVDF
jgi:carbonic anhydrase